MECPSDIVDAIELEDQWSRSWIWKWLPIGSIGEVVGEDMMCACKIG